MINDCNSHPLMFVRLFFLERKEQILMIKHSCIIELIQEKESFLSLMNSASSIDDNLIVFSRIIITLRDNCDSSVSLSRNEHTSYSLVKCSDLFLEQEFSSVLPKDKDAEKKNRLRKGGRG